MIEQYIVSELGTIAELRTVSGSDTTGNSGERSYPVAAPVGDIDPPFCIYTRVSGDIQRDLSGAPVFYRDVFRLDLYDFDTDALFALERKLIDSLTKINVDAGDVYIFSAEASPGPSDGFDMTMEIHQRSIIYTVMYWR